jgi:hypothetical protein
MSPWNPFILNSNERSLVANSQKIEGYYPIPNKIKKLTKKGVSVHSWLQFWNWNFNYLIENSISKFWRKKIKTPEKEIWKAIFKFIL